jgi:lysozyme family protein
VEAFEKAFVHTVGIERGYVDNPADPGGATCWGITERVARADGYSGDMRELPLERAQSIYRRKYWATRQLPCNELALWYEPAALEAFDVAVNCGIGEAAIFLQRALNALNRRGTLWPDVKEDGDFGALSLDALHACRDPQDKARVLKMMIVQRGEYYLDLTRRTDKFETFIRGWFDKRVLLPEK